MLEEAVKCKVSKEVSAFYMLLRRMALLWQAFSAWIHICAIRLFVESILRYGLPPRFLAALMKPNQKSTTKLRKVLGSLFGNSGELSAPWADVADDCIECPAETCIQTVGRQNPGICACWLSGVHWLDISHGVCDYRHKSVL